MNYPESSNCILKLPHQDATCISVKVSLIKVTYVTQPLMNAVLNDGRFFQLKLFNRLSINSVTIYRPNESKIYVFYGNGNNSILAKGGLTSYRTGGAKCELQYEYL